MRRFRELTFVLFILLVLVVVLPERPAVVMVLVIDPISEDPELVPSVVKALDNPGYSVTHVVGSDVTVDRMKKLEGVDVLIMRVHSSVNDDAEWVFTGERYDNNRYPVEQMTDEVHRARTKSHQRQGHTSEHSSRRRKAVCSFDNQIVLVALDLAHNLDSRVTDGDDGIEVDTGVRAIRLDV